MGPRARGSCGSSVNCMGELRGVAPDVPNREGSAHPSAGVRAALDAGWSAVRNGRLARGHLGGPF
jgi:hypothetical protein